MGISVLFILSHLENNQGSGSMIIRVSACSIFLGDETFFCTPHFPSDNFLPNRNCSIFFTTSQKPLSHSFFQRFITLYKQIDLKKCEQLLTRSLVFGKIIQFPKLLKYFNVKFARKRKKFCKELHERLITKNNYNLVVIIKL